MKVSQFVWAFLFLLLGVAAAQQPAPSNSAGGKPDKSKLGVVSVKNPDGSIIKARADVETLMQLAVEFNVFLTNAAAAATANQFSAETKVLAEKGDAIAQVLLGFRYFRGLGVTQDHSEAAKWFRKAADQGNFDAENNLGSCYANGFGVPQDKIEAAKWFHSADVDEFKETRVLAEQGDAESQSDLGRIYESGLGVPQDMFEAAKWFRRAANQGNAFAQFNLGMLYMGGLGVPLDYVESYKWSNLAAGQRNSSAQFDSAVKNRDEIAKFMTPSQIAEAQKMSREFRPRKESRSDNSASSDNPTATGTGFFITPDGYLISNYHVVKDATKVRLVTSTGLIDAKVVKVDAANDLALLKADIIPEPPSGFVLDNGVVTKFAPLPIASSRSVKLGGTVATVGFPNTGMQGFAPKFAKGEIASLSGAADDARYFQISVPVQPGNSGGALVDERGNVVGVVSAKLNAATALAASGALPENVNYAVKSSFLLSFLESVPDVANKLKEPRSLQTATPKFEDVVKSAQDAAVLVLVY